MDTMLLLIVLIPVVIAIATAIFQWLWNITMPEVLNLKKITFWQAFRILIIAGFLFGSGSFIRFNMGG
jgi:hypothetical protein